MDAVAHALRTRLSSGKRKRLSEALVQAAAVLKEAPYGNRHLVLVTDGVEANATSAQAEAIRQLSGAQATTHVISYTAIGRETMKRSSSLAKFGNTRARTAATWREKPNGRSHAIARPVNVTLIRICASDGQRKQIRSDETAQPAHYTREETGGVLFTTTAEETSASAKWRARSARSIVTYRPKRPLAEGRAGEYRRVKVVLRRPGLSVRSRSGYIATGTQ